MITQTTAIFVDAYRELNSKKMFWITLIISGGVMAVFALLGATPTSLKFVKWNIDLPPGMSGPVLYKQLYSSLVFGFWLTFVATILALISTASSFPDLMSGGAIDLFAAKPISRLRLFLTKYLAGLLFVLLQVSLFAVGSYLVLGFRGGVWEPRLFWSIPIVLCFFSYLYAVSVLLGVKTRSTVATILFTILFWFILWAVHKSETGIYAFMMIKKQEAALYDHRITAQEDVANRLATTTSPTTQTSLRLTETRQLIVQDRENRQRAGALANKLETWHRVFYWVKTVLPKATETTDLLDRILITDTEAAAGNSQQRRGPSAEASQEDVQMDAMGAGGMEAVRAFRSRSIGWIVGTSLGFEVVVIALAAWIFCRRDY